MTVSGAPFKTDIPPRTIIPFGKTESVLHPAQQPPPKPKLLFSHHHVHETLVQRAVREAVLKAGIVKHAGCHTFRHSFATHLLEDGNSLNNQSVTANSSGFPLQIATVHAVNQSNNWHVLFEEHSWQSDRTGSEGFIDIVAVNESRGISAMVMECKRVRQTAWVFLIPKESPSMRSQTTVLWHSFRRDSKWTAYDWKNLQADPSSHQSQYCAIPGQEQGRRNLLTKKLFLIERKMLQR